MRNRLIGHMVTGFAVLATVAPTAAGGGYPVECYKPYRTAPVYDTVTENIEVNPGYTHVEVSPAIYGTRQRNVLVSPERLGYRTIPAQYGYVRERAIVAPARTIKRLVPAITETRYRKVKIDDGGYSWEWRVINGKKVLCKIKHKARYGKVAETVTVEPARYVHETVPAQYGYQKRQVIVQPERTERYVIPARYETVTEQVVVQPEQRRKVHVPPSYQTVQRQVLVAEGTSGWKRVRIKNHCSG